MMSDMGLGSEPKKVVRFCMKGHEIVYTVGELMRQRCPICGSPVDRSRQPIDYDELQRMKEEQAAMEAQQAAMEAQQAAMEAQKAAEEVQTADVPAEQPPKENPFGQKTPVTTGMFGQPRDPLGSVTDFRMRRRFEDPIIESKKVDPIPPNPFSPNPIPPNPAPPNPAPQNLFLRKGETTSPSGFYLSLYGERIAIPKEGAWIGREGLGREWFDGNLMISRKHVFIKPDMQSGRLQVNEDRSLNGVSASMPGSQPEHLKGARMMGPGEILWIYNIPLLIER